MDKWWEEGRCQLTRELLGCGELRAAWSEVDGAEGGREREPFSVDAAVAVAEAGDQGVAAECLPSIACRSSRAADARHFTRERLKHLSRQDKNKTAANSARDRGQFQAARNFARPGPLSPPSLAPQLTTRSCTSGPETSPRRLPSL